MEGCIIKRKNSAGLVKRYRKMTPADVEVKRIAQVVHRVLAQFVDDRIIDKIVDTKLNGITAVKTTDCEVHVENIQIVEDASPYISQQPAAVESDVAAGSSRATRKSTRKTIPTIRDDIDFVAELPTTETDDGDSLRYMFTTGARLNARLLYTLDEKYLYRCKDSAGDFERYICIDRNCGLGLNLCKTTGLAKKSGKRTEHNHGNQEPKFLRDRFLDALKRECIESNGAEDVHALFLKHQKADPVGGELVNFKDVRSSLRKNSRKNAPKSARTKARQGDDGENSLLDLQISQMSESGATEESGNIDESDQTNVLIILKNDNTVETRNVSRSTKSSQKEAVAKDNDDPLEYVFTPSARLNSRLLYTIDEKNLYRRKARGDDSDRYICSYPGQSCLVSLILCHATGVAKKCGPHYQHTHAHRESQFRKNRFMHELKKECSKSGEKLQTLYAKHLAADPVGGEHVSYKAVKSSLQKNRVAKLQESATEMDEFEQESIWD